MSLSSDVVASCCYLKLIKCGNWDFFLCLSPACSSGSKCHSDNSGDFPGLEEKEKAGEGWTHSNIVVTSGCQSQVPTFSLILLKTWFLGGFSMTEIIKAFSNIFVKIYLMLLFYQVDKAREEMEKKKADFKAGKSLVVSAVVVKFHLGSGAEAKMSKRNLYYYLY